MDQPCPVRSRNPINTLPVIPTFQVGGSPELSQATQAVGVCCEQLDGLMGDIQATHTAARQHVLFLATYAQSCQVWFGMVWVLDVDAI